jgi:hypothetical protein
MGLPAWLWWAESHPTGYGLDLVATGLNDRSSQAFAPSEQSFQKLLAIVACLQTSLLARIRSKKSAYQRKSYF